jgi:hypothetical protein
MPLRNRVTPFGELIATPARGLMFGNRGGRFHDANRELAGRPWRGPRWLICLTSFKGRQRQVWSTGYTELFFLDEVTALAAGHRPCAECRRSAARAFQAALRPVCGAAPSLSVIDASLHAERLDGRAKRVHLRPAHSLPCGAMLEQDGEAWVVRGHRMQNWSPTGYGPSRALPEGEASVLTPPTALAALAAGYVPLWHPTASRA